MKHTCKKYKCQACEMLSGSKYTNRMETAKLLMFFPFVIVFIAAFAIQALFSGDEIYINNINADKKIVIVDR